MKVAVQYQYEDFIEIENVVTVEDLKTGLGNHYNFDDHDNFDEWKLFQAGLELDQPNVLLADLLPGGQIVLTAPPDGERIGPKSRVYKSDKTRFMLVERGGKMELIPLRRETDFTAQCSEKTFFKKGQKFGLITNIVYDKKEGHKRQVQCDIYEATDDGYVFLWTDDDDLMQLQLEHPAKMFLIRNKEAVHRFARELRKKMEPRTFDETELKLENGTGKNEHIEWILDQIRSTSNR